MKEKSFLLVTSLICTFFIVFHNINKYFIIPFYLKDMGLIYTDSRYFYYISYGVLIFTIIYFILTDFIKIKFRISKFNIVIINIQVGIYLIFSNIIRMKIASKFLVSTLNLDPWQSPLLIIMFLFSSLYGLGWIYILNKFKSKACK